MHLCHHLLQEGHGALRLAPAASLAVSALQIRVPMVRQVEDYHEIERIISHREASTSAASSRLPKSSNAYIIYQVRARGHSALCMHFFAPRLHAC